MTGELARQFHGRIETEAHALETDYRPGGEARLLRDISERQRNRLPGGMVYGLFDAGGHPLAGAMPEVACQPRLDRADGSARRRRSARGDGEARRLCHAAFRRALSSGRRRLGRGARISALSSSKTFGGSALLSLTLAVAGGLFLSGEFLKRIETINRTAEAIIEGDIHRRIPRRAAPDDLDRLAATLNRMLDRTSDLMDSLKHLSNNIAHDLRTPLGRLRRLLDDALEKPAEPAEYRAVIEQGVAEVDAILDMFGAMLRIAQIESGNRRSGFSRFYLSRVVEDICETFAPSFEEDGKVRDAADPEGSVDPGRSGAGDLVAGESSGKCPCPHPAGHPRHGLARRSGAAPWNCAWPMTAPACRKRNGRKSSSASTGWNPAAPRRAMAWAFRIVAAVADLHVAELSARTTSRDFSVGMIFPSAA